MDDRKSSIKKINQDISAQDITERKRIEQELRKERDFSAAVLDTAGALIVVLDREGKITRFNYACEEMTGYSEAEVLGREIMDLLIPEEQIPGVQQTWNALCAGDFPNQHENCWVAKDGSRRLIAWSNTAITREDGNTDYIIGIGVDITERTMAEQYLRESQRDLSRAQAVAHVGSWRIDTRRKEPRWSEEAYRIFGIPEGTPITYELILGLIHPEDRDYFDRKWNSAIISGEPYEIEYRIIVGETVRWIYGRAELEFDSQGQVIGATGTAQDITERKRAEEAKLEKEKQIKALIVNVKSAVAFVDQIGQITIVNPAFLKMFGLNETDTIKNINDQNWKEWQVFEPDGTLLHVDEHPVRKAAMTGKAVRDKLVGVRLPSGGDLIWMLISADPIFGPDGSVESTICTYHDITERKRAEEALKESEERLALALSAGRLAAWDWDMMTEKVVWNDEHFRIMGYEVGKVKPSFQAWAERVHPEDRFAMEEAFAQALEQSGDYGNEFRSYWPDGTVRWIQSHGHIQHDAEGRPIRSYGIMIDTTEKKLAEVALQKAKDELEDKVRERTVQLAEINESLVIEIEERKRTEKRLRSAQKNLRAMAAEIVMADERSRQHFAADLHDTVIQTIGAAKMRSHLIQNDIPEKAFKEFKELQDLISQSITQARFIMAEMSPPVLNELGFIPAMEWLTEQIETQHGINVEFSTNGVMPLQHEIQVLLFQATRELLMNVVKHARADKALVKISGDKKKVRIEVTDDGKGFDKRQAFRTDVSTGGFGLFSIRERIRHFGGHLIIQSKSGKGTRVVLTAPRTSGEITP